MIAIFTEVSVIAEQEKFLVACLLNIKANVTSRLGTGLGARELYYRTDPYITCTRVRPVFDT